MIEYSRSTVINSLVDEDSRSRSGRHVVKKRAFILLKNGLLKPVSKLEDRVLEVRDIEPTYSRGKARCYRVRLDHGDYAIQVSFVKNLWGRVKGFIEAYNYKGELVYRAKYFDGELRRSIGAPIYAWIIRLVTQLLKIPVSKTRLGDERK